MLGLRLFVVLEVTKSIHGEFFLGTTRTGPQGFVPEICSEKKEQYKSLNRAKYLYIT